jgi:hypothetical protein
MQMILLVTPAARLKDLVQFDASSWVGIDQYSHIATALRLESSRQAVFPANCGAEVLESVEA